MRLPVPLRGLASAPFRAFGIRPSRMNPNTCTICELMFTRVMKARQVVIDATVLFADLRGYTGLSQSHAAGAVSALLDAFYDECAEAIWERDGLLNKTMGDAVMAVFNFPIRRDDHASQAVLAARAIQTRWGARRDVARRSVRRRQGDDRRRRRDRLWTNQFRRVRPDAPRSDRNRNRREHRLAGAIGGRCRRDPRDGIRLRARATGTGRKPRAGLPAEGVRGADPPLGSLIVVPVVDGAGRWTLTKRLP